MRLIPFDYEGKSLICDTFIETGSYLGNCMDQARTAGFRICHTIDICERHWKHVSKRFAVFPYVHAHLGNSPDVLKKIIDPHTKTLFWLDAHYQNGPADEMGDIENPLMDELEVILSFEWDEMPAIMIDDAKFFLPTAYHGVPAWPRFSEIESVLCWYKIGEYSGILYCIPKVP